MKSTNEQSLRFQVEKWLAPGPTMPVHVTEFSRTRSGGRRYVCVETSLSVGSRALFFFRHDDGYWRVFPPTPDRPKMAADDCQPPKRHRARTGSRDKVGHELSDQAIDETF